MGRTLLILNERDLRHPWAGGSELHITETGKRFALLGYAPTLLCTRFPGAAAEEMCDGIRIRRFGNRLTYYLLMPFMVRRALRTAPDAVIIEHLNKLPFCTPLYTRAPVLPLTHHLFGATAFRQVPFPVACVVYAAERVIPLVYRGRRFVAVSPSTRDDLQARGVPSASISVIPNGLDHARYHARGRVLDTRPTLLVLGRVEFYKRIDLVVQALRRLVPVIPDVQLLIVGDGGARATLEGQVAHLGLGDRVRFTGFISEEEKVACAQRAYAVVNTSEKEGWGLTVLEANACGLPAIASDVPGLRDAVRDGESGVLVPHGDLDSLTAALRRVLQEPEYRERLSRGALAWASAFSWERAAADIAAVIEAVATPTAAPAAQSLIDAPRRRPAEGES